jgi:hypothetical protein
MLRKIITAPATRRELLNRLRNIRRLAERGAQPLGLNVPEMKRQFEMIANHCLAAVRELEPWKRDRQA